MQDLHTSLPKNKTDARMAGVKLYFTGVACKQGHFSPRWTNGGGCKECIKAHNYSAKGIAWFKTYRDTPKEQERMKAKRKTDDYRERQRKRSLNPARKEYSKFLLLRIKYNITADDFYTMMKSQNSKCAICFVEFCEKSHKSNSPSVDHCHATGVVRGLLCTNCNHGLGKFRDNAENLIRAADYLTQTR